MKNTPGRAIDSKKNHKLKRLGRRFDLYLYILSSVEDSHKLPIVMVGKKKKSLQWYTNRLKSLNLLSKVSYGTWELTEKGKEILEQPTEQQVKSALCDKLILLNNPIRLDFAARIIIPVVRMLDMFPYDVVNRAGMYSFERMPIYDMGLTFHLSQNQKSLEVFIHHNDLEKESEMETMIRKVAQWTKDYFSSRRIMILDNMNARTTFIKFGIHDPMAKKALPEGTYETVYLGRKRAKILPKDVPTEAWVSYDATPSDKTIHTNDMTYGRRYLMMPETLDRMAKEFVPAINQLTRQIKTHLAVQNKQLENLEIQNKNQEKMNEVLEIIKDNMKK